MGDFNMELDNSAMRYLHKTEYQNPYSAMKDAWLSVNPGKKNIGTRHNFKGRTTGPQIDHISISEYTQAINVNIDQYAFDGRYPSDHFPVIATIRIPTKNYISMKRWNQNL